MADDSSSRAHPVLVGLGALVAVSLLVGGVVALVALGAAKVVGIGETRSASTAEPSLVLPSATGRPGPPPGAGADPSRPPSASGTPSASASASRAPRTPALTLRVAPLDVAPGERIDLAGTYPTGEGATVQIQRFEGGWVDFPVSATVSGGTYATYIYTERVGPQRFRVLDRAVGAVSNVVRVTVG